MAKKAPSIDPIEQAVADAFAKANTGLKDALDELMAKGVTQSELITRIDQQAPDTMTAHAAATYLKVAFAQRAAAQQADHARPKS